MSDLGFVATAAMPVSLRDGEIHIWFCELSVTDMIARRRAAQSVLHRLLAGYCGHEAGELAFVTGPHGKPALANGMLAFNLSHSGAGVVLAITRGVEIGVDLESALLPRRYSALAQRYFCRREAEAVAAAAGPERESLFLRLWTAKEALLKALGRGLAFGLDRLEFDPATDPPTLRWISPDGGAASDWHVHALPLERPFVGHVAWRGETRRLCVFRDATPPSGDTGSIPAPVVGHGLTG